MSWSARFRLRQHLKGSLWALPLLGGILGAILGDSGRLLEGVDPPVNWTYSASTATTVLAAIVGAMVALTGFALTVSVLGVQMATGTFSARYMRILLRDPMLKGLLAVLVGTTTFSFALLGRTESENVPDFGVTVAGGLVLVSLILFLVFLDRFLHRLRPVAVAAFVARAGMRAFEQVMAAAASREAPDVLPPDFQSPRRARPRRPERRVPARYRHSTAGASSATRVRTGVGSSSATLSATSFRRGLRSSRSTTTTRAQRPTSGCEG